MVSLRHLFHDPHRLHADRTHAPQQLNHGLFILREPIRIELLRNRRVFGLLLFVAFENPLQRGICPQPIFPRLRRDAAQGGLVNQFQFRLCLCEPSIASQRLPAVSPESTELRRIWGRCPDPRAEVSTRSNAYASTVFIPQMQLHQPLPPIRPLPEILIKRNSRKLALQIDLILRPIRGMMQDGVHVMENIDFGYSGFDIRLSGIAFRFSSIAFRISFFELTQRPIGDILRTRFAPNFAVTVERETLRNLHH